MNNKVNLGGDRLGSGEKTKVDISKKFPYSTQNLNKQVMTTISAGTLVPVYCNIGLPGDSWNIKCAMDIQTEPTEGPMYGRLKAQLDWFKIPVRQYHLGLLINELERGNNMDKAYIPLIEMTASNLNPTQEVNGQQISSSCIFAYLGIRGLGHEKPNSEGQDDEVTRQFNALPYLSYFDIFRWYYANKQEDFAYIIHNNLSITTPSVSICRLFYFGTNVADLTTSDAANVITQNNDQVRIDITYGSGTPTDAEISRFRIKYGNTQGSLIREDFLTNIFSNVWIDGDSNTIVCTGFNASFGQTYPQIKWYSYSFEDEIISITDSAPKLRKFELKNIDAMKKSIYSHPDSSPFTIGTGSIEPYNLPLQTANNLYSKQTDQEGLLLKTYQSDVNNSWMQTDWLDGENGISEISKVLVEIDNANPDNGYFKIDDLILSYKINTMLMAVGLSGGTPSDWQKAVHGVDSHPKSDKPVYLGSLIKEVVFQEIHSTNATDNDPLGTLAGKGRFNDKHKGGKIKTKLDEHCIMMAIVSLTPRVVYSQGNKWFNNLKTFDDFHKPHLDAIGFQDLIVDTMAYFDSQYDPETETWEFRSAGKQPAWINYHTDVDESYGNFAKRFDSMYMTFNRDYNVDYDDAQNSTGRFGIKDLTTYIDPSKYNYIFADTRLDAMNYHIYLDFDIKARRKMSARVIPNLIN
jgi:hypothetical protein